MKGSAWVGVLMGAVLFAGCAGKFGSPQTKVMLARELLEAQRYTKALELYGSALEHDPTFKRGPDAERASRLQELLEALQIDPLTDPGRERELQSPSGEEALWGHLAIVSYVQGMEFKALLYAQAATGTNPDRRIYRDLLSVLEKLTGLAADPQMTLPMKAAVAARLKKAEEEFLSEHYPQAERLLREVLLVQPENENAWEKLGSVRYATGDLAEAQTAYRKALALRPDNPELKDFVAEKGWGGD